MNGKVTRRLRKLAQVETATLDDRAYVGGTDGSLRLHPDCTRGFYRRLKRLVRKGVSVEARKVRLRLTGEP